MQANIFIVGDIGKYQDAQGNQVDGVVLLDVIEQVKKYPQADRYKVNIKTHGGSVEEGSKIIDYLRSLDKPIDTYGFGIVASMGTSIFLIGEKRELKEGTDFFIHLPQGGVAGDSEFIMQYANEMAELQKLLLKQYKEVTSLTDEALLPLLREETTLTYEQAYNLGFANYKSEALQPVAYFNDNTNTNIDKMSTTTDETKVAVDKNWLEERFAAIAKLFKAKPTNIMMTAADGETMIEFPEIEEGQPIPLGAKALIDGSDAEGEHVMPSGMTYVFAGGELTEIKEPQEEGITGEEMNKLISDLKEQLAASLSEKETLKEEAATAKKEKETLEKEVGQLKEEFTNFQKELKTKFELAPTNRKDDEPTEVKSEASKALQALREKRKNRR